MFDYLGKRKTAYVTFLIAITLLAIVAITNKLPRKGYSYVETTTTYSVGSETAYYYGMIPIVRKELKSPYSAVFLPYENIVKYRVDDCTWEFMGYVDSQNSFGAMLRTKFICIVNYNPETDRWQKVNLLFGD